MYAYNLWYSSIFDILVYKQVSNLKVRQFSQSTVYTQGPEYSWYLASQSVTWMTQALKSQVQGPSPCSLTHQIDRYYSLCQIKSQRSVIFLVSVLNNTKMKGKKKNQ